MIIERIGGESLEITWSIIFLRSDSICLRQHSSRTLLIVHRRRSTNVVTAQYGEVCGLPHDESAYQFAIAHECAGHAGLFSTVPGSLNFLESLLRADDGFTKSIMDAAEAGLGWQIEGDFLGHYADAVHSAKQDSPAPVSVSIRPKVLRSSFFPIARIRSDRRIIPQSIHFDRILPTYSWIYLTVTLLAMLRGLSTL